MHIHAIANGSIADRSTKPQPQLDLRDHLQNNHTSANDVFVRKCALSFGRDGHRQANPDESIQNIKSSSTLRKLANTILGLFMITSITGDTAIGLPPDFSITDSDGYKIASNQKWNDNVTVLAGSRQTEEVFYARENPPLTAFFYTMGLIKELHKPEVRSLQGAQITMMQNGIKFHNQHPVQSAGKTVQGWDKDNKNDRRLVLMLGDEIIEEEPRITTLNFLESTLRDDEIFDVKKENIKRIDAASKDDFAIGLNWLFQKISKMGGKDIEVLVYFLGHSNPPLSKRPAEGARVGRFMNGFTEEELKKLVNALPPNAKVTVIMDTCFSGSLIAGNDSKESKKLAAFA